MEKYSEGFDDLRLSFRAAYLISGFINKKLTADEEQELDRWILSSDANMQLFEDLTDEKSMENFLQWCAARNVERNLIGTKERIRFKKRSKVVSILRIAAAAVLVGLIAFAAYFVFAPTEGEVRGPVRIASADILPGGERAILRMQNGERIDLDDGDTIVSENIRIKDGVVYYEENENAPEQHEIIIPRKGFYRLVLPDGSRVWLNAESSIKFPSRFSSEERKVAVTGETYFEIEKDASRPFIVNVNGIDVRALGTAFNIMAYSDENEIRTTLVEGAIRVSNDKHREELRPGQQIKISQGEWKGIEEVRVGAIIAWKNNQFKLQDSRIEDIMRKVERWYDAEVDIKDKIDYHFNGTIDRGVPVSKLLQLLEQTGHVHFHINGNKITVTK